MVWPQSQEFLFTLAEALRDAQRLGQKKARPARGEAAGGA
jgi:hypothetical protein